MEEKHREQILFKGHKGTWSIVAGRLPDGIELDVDNGQLYGEPTEWGEFPVTFKLVNACGETQKEVNVITCIAPEIISNEIIFDCSEHEEEEEEEEEPQP